MNKAMKIFYTAAFIMIIVMPVFSDDEREPVSGPEEPQQTEIILPQMYLEIEDLTIEEIDAVVPDDTAVMLSSLELPLPDPGAIEIPAEVFALSDADVPDSTVAEPGAEQGSSFFSESTIGAGTSAHIIGDINLYHIGEQPDFRLRFFHDSLDGFAGHRAGEGYSGRDELIEAELNYSDENIDSDLLVSYSENENGLQDASEDFYTVTRRKPELSGDIEWDFAKYFTLLGSLDASMSFLQLNGAEPLGYTLFSVAPELGVVFGRDDLNCGLVFKYGIEGQGAGISPAQQLGGGLTFTFEASNIFRIDGGVDLLWSNYNTLYPPFEIMFSGSSVILEYELAGGYSAGVANRSVVWDIFPAAAGAGVSGTLGTLPLTSGWFVDGGVKWNLSDRVSLMASAGFSALENSLVPVVSATDVFTSLSTSGGNRLDFGAGLYMKITDGLNIGADWSGQFLDNIDWFSPQHQITGEVEFTSADKNFGIVGDLCLNIYNEQQTWYPNDWVPAIGLEAYLRLSEGFVLSVSGDDIGAVFLTEGRNLWNGYLDKGAMLQAMIRISL